jgi:hypothetical protein
MFLFKNFPIFPIVIYKNKCNFATDSAGEARLTIKNHDERAKA